MSTQAAVPELPSDAPAGVALVDTHCHLDADALADGPTAGILARAEKAGVRRVVTIGTRLESSRAAARIARIHQNVWATVGIDPNDLDGYDEDMLAELADLAASPNVVAVGEIGLDYYWDRAPRSLQRSAFEAQLRLAREHDLPVVIHNRDADADVAAILTDWASDATDTSRPLGVMHCFASDRAMAERMFDAGFLISLSGIVTFRNNDVVPEVARSMPADALVLETDAPFLAPHPHRGKRNEPAMVRLIAERVADIRDEPLEEVARTTSANAARLFRWDDQ